MIFYVQQKNTSKGDGTRDNPFSAISQAADIAKAGDTVVIGDGIYREWVIPKNSGLSDNDRITYINADGSNPVISGAEEIHDWTPYKNNVWFTEVENSLFGEYNPYADELFGDWYNSMGQVHHAGELFLNGEAMYETASFDELLKKPKVKSKSLRWFSVVKEDKTVIYGDFAGENPNSQCTEISVRPYCFFPEKEGINYITVSGITMRQAATQWAPPTAFQSGIIGVNWSKGWIIEGCKIHDSKCCGISLGKKHEAKDNCWSKNPAKDGSQTYTEIIFSNLNEGWSKENIGGHIVRNNEIYNCGQTGIVGCMGGAFSHISKNHIHHINIRHEFSGAETAGIKLHASIDAVIEKNVIHDCNRGIWLDWEAQGAVVRKNALFFNNDDQDLFIEVCHGPCIVESNLLLSGQSFLNVSQGTALIHNLFAGKIRLIPDTNRFTLYHLPHSTMVGGVMHIYGGDDRIINNIFVGKKLSIKEKLYNLLHKKEGSFGTACYESYRYTDENKKCKSDKPMADVGRPLPIKVCDNVYLNGAKCRSREKNSHIVSGFTAQIRVEEEKGHYYLFSNLGDILSDGFTADRVSTEILGRAFESEQVYENSDGSAFLADSDFTDNQRGERVKIGPFEKFENKILLV
ncbi:MAG: right-handed parallel beta-helix repeat-containing protein [Eubacterium sp.]